MNKITLTVLLVLLMQISTYSQIHDQVVTINPSYYGPKLILDDANTANKVPIEFRSNNIIKWELGTRNASEQYDLALWRYYNSTYSPVIWFNNDNGNVGIGLSAPESKLHVLGSYQQSGTEVFFDNGDKINLVRNGYYNNGWKRLNSSFSEMLTMRDGGFKFQVAANGASESAITWSELLTIKNDGNVGIGSTDPNSKLEIMSSGAHYNGEPSLTIKDASNRGTLFLESVTNRPTDFVFKNNNRLSWTISTRESTEDYALRFFPSVNGTSWSTSAMSLLTNGNVGIGTSNPTHKLDVKGTIHATEVIVDLNVEGPDYVFEPEYDLKNLSDLDQFLKTNKHLPEVPSAAQMKEEGVNMVEMQMLLLKKVEELTLHLIEQQKEIKSLKSEITSLKTN